MHLSTMIKGAIFSLLAVILGAFGAHALKAVLTAEQLDSFNTAVRYLMFHGLALLVIGIIKDKMHHPWIKISGLLMFSGTILFSGSIMLLVCRKILGMEFLTLLGPVTPIGGTILIAGWIYLILALLKEKQS